MSLREKLVQAIRTCGPIPFSRYMEMCLYDAGHGYYSRNAEQFGKAGDFYTSSDVHAVFGRLLARQFEEMWRVLGSPERVEILELGPGRGLFARDVLDWSEKKFPEFFESVHYSLHEQSAALRERLKTTLDRHLATGRVSIEGGRKEESANPAIIFANEFFDALPVEIVGSQGELRIGEENGRFVETWSPLSEENRQYLARFSILPQAVERVEAGRIAYEQMSELAKKVRKGFLIAIDYGYSQAEQLAGRHCGTVTAYRQHSISASPYEAPGEQDITAHVNFTALSAAAAEQGMAVQPLLTQSQFLLGIGETNQFADAFEDCRLPQEQAKVALQLKHLITPAGVGETFQVMAASKGVPPEDAAKLSGLNFALSK